MKKQLIINADDFGYDEAIDAGILMALEHGVVTSTTVMIAVPEAERRIRPYVADLIGRAGVHLQLTRGRPLTNGTSFRTSDGTFPRHPSLLTNPDPDEVYEEWKAQVDAFRALGMTPTHLDSHHYVHLDPRLTRTYLAVAEELDLPCRAGGAKFARRVRASGIRCPGRTDGGWTMNNPTLESLKAHLRSAARPFRRLRSYELVTHPGHIPAAGVSTYAAGRQHELSVLTSSDARALIDELGFDLVSYAALTS